MKKIAYYFADLFLGSTDRLFYTKTMAILLSVASVLFVFCKKADVHEISEYKGFRATNIQKFGGKYVSVTFENTFKDGHKTVVTKEFVLTDILPLLHFKNDTVQ